MSPSPATFFFFFFLKECLLTRRESGIRHSRGSASTVAYAGSSPAFPPWPTHLGKEAYPDRNKQGTHRLAAAEHQLLQLVVHTAAVAVRQPSDGLSLSALRGVAVVEPPGRRPIAVSLPTSILSRSLSLPTPPADCRLPALLKR